MDTNFYLDKKRKIQVGTRSPAGLYCWNCKITLCKGGIDSVRQRKFRDGWYDACPICGKNSYAVIIIKTGKYSTRKKYGVAPCMSFTWAIKKEQIPKNKRVIYDDYGNKWTMKEFNKMIEEECPIQFTNSND